MSDEGAAGALAAAVLGALRAVPGLSQVADGRSIQAGDAAATLELGRRATGATRMVKARSCASR